MGAANTSNQEALAASTGSETPEALVASDPPVESAPVQVSLETQIAMATAVLEANGYVVRKRTVVQRALMEKADPDQVKAYFESTGLNRKEIADAVGVTVSVIATVQNPNGDRWSALRYGAAKILIDAYVQAKTAAATAAAKAETK